MAGQPQLVAPMLAAERAQSEHSDLAARQRPFVQTWRATAGISSIGFQGVARQLSPSSRNHPSRIDEAASGRRGDGDGADAVPQAYQEMDAYRHGRFVVVVFTEAGYLEEAQATAFADQSYAALLENFNRLNAGAGGL